MSRWDGAGKTKPFQEERGYQMWDAFLEIIPFPRQDKTLQCLEYKCVVALPLACHGSSKYLIRLLEELRGTCGSDSLGLLYSWLQFLRVIGLFRVVVPCMIWNLRHTYLLKGKKIKYNLFLLLNVLKGVNLQRTINILHLYFKQHMYSPLKNSSQQNYLSIYYFLLFYIFINS